MSEIVDTTENSPEGPLRMTHRRRQAVTLGVMTGMFLASMEMTIVGTAMPTVISALGGLNHYSWVFSAYLITSTVTVPVWGKLSDIYGRRVLYQIGVAMFLIGSVLSGMSTSMTQLIIFRALQGLGAGVLIPMALTIIGDIYTLEERAKMQALFSGVWGLSSIVGPLVGGFITDHLSWRWVFYINIPFGLAAAIILGVALQEPPRTRKPVIDYAGAATLMVAITLLMFVLVEGGGQIHSLLSPANLGLLGLSVVLLSLFVWVELHAAEPILPFSLFADRAISVAVAAIFFVGMGMFGAITFIPLFAQGTLGATATEAGTFLTPLMLSWVTVSVFSSRLLLRIGSRHTAMLGLAILTLGFLMLSLFQPGMPRWRLYADLAIVGSGLGTTILTLLLAMQQAVPRSLLGITTSLNQFSRQIGGAVGVAIMGAVMSGRLSASLAAMAAPGSAFTPAQAAHLAANPNALVDPAARSTLSPQVVAYLQTAMSSSLHSVFWLCTALSALALATAWMLPRRHEDAIAMRNANTVPQPVNAA